MLMGVAAGLMTGGAHDAQAVLGGIGNVTASDNPHNFSYTSTGVKTSDPFETRVCVFCHTPHAADMSAGLLNAPLWNHALSTTPSYTVKLPGVYTDGTSGLTVNLNATPLSVPDGASRLCLGCHDGTVSIGNVRSVSGEIPIDTTHTCIDTDGSLNEAACPTLAMGTTGNDLTTKHVVSVPMNGSLITAHDGQCFAVGPQTTKLTYPWDGTGDTGKSPQATSVFLRPTGATYTSSGISGTSIQGSPGCSGNNQCTKNYGTGYNYGVQCSTCHDPHYWANVTDPQKPGYKFLPVGFNNLCAACHYTPAVACP
jgi:hypothetical protein